MLHSLSKKPPRKPVGACHGGSGRPDSGGLGGRKGLPGPPGLDDLIAVTCNPKFIGHRK